MISTLTGPNDFARRQALDKLIDNFVKDQGAMALEQIDGDEAEYQQLYDAVTGLPFLTNKKLVVLHNPSANKAWVDNAEKLLSDMSEATELVLVEPKLDKRTAYYRFLKAATVFQEFSELDSYGLIKWAISYVREQHSTMSQDVARYLVERLGSNQQLLRHELDKLMLYNGEITRQTVDLLTEPTPQGSIFELLDAAFSGNSRRTIQLYENQRRMKVDPLAIIALVAWQLHALALLKTAGRRTPEQIAKDGKLNPFVIRKSETIARSISLTQLERLIHRALQLDIRLKNESINADDAMQAFLLSIARRS